MISILAIAAILSLAICKDLPTVSVDDFRQEWFEQYVDHYDYMSYETYQQRYWINDKYWDETNPGPIFIYICGEYTCSVPATRLYPFMVGAENNALLFVLEHRYYGESQLFEDWSTSSFEFLSAEQALADLAYFISSFNDGASYQWVVIGGSYPGALSAWFRQRYPHLAVASWASSGVVQPIEDFYLYDKQVFDSTSKSSPYCPYYIQRVTAYVSGAFDLALQGVSANLASEIMSIYGGGDMRYDEFMYFFADIFAGKVQYGARTELCAFMDTIADEPFLDQVRALADYSAADGSFPTDYDYRNLQNTEIDTGASGRQWTFQYCSAYGWFQTPDKENPVRSELIGPDYWEPFCQRVFSDAEDFELDLARSEAEFGGWGIQGTNTFFVNGGEDPWQWAGMGTSPNNSGQVARVADCDDCGHCAELYTPEEGDPEELTEIREEIREWIAEILSN